MTVVCPRTQRHHPLMQSSLRYRACLRRLTRKLPPGRVTLVNTRMRWLQLVQLSVGWVRLQRWVQLQVRVRWVEPEQPSVGWEQLEQPPALGWRKLGHALAGWVQLQQARASQHLHEPPSWELLLWTPHQMLHLLRL